MYILPDVVFVSGRYVCMYRYDRDSVNCSKSISFIERKRGSFKMEEVDCYEKGFFL